MLARLSASAMMTSDLERTRTPVLVKYSGALISKGLPV